MSGVLVAALAAGLAAPNIRALLWGVPIGLFTWGLLLRTVLGAALSACFTGMLLLSVASDARAGFMAFVVAMVMTTLSSRRSRHARGLMFLTLLAAKPEGDASATHASAAERKKALTAIESRFSSFAGKLKPREHARLAGLVSLPLTAANHWATVLSILNDVPLKSLSGDEAARHAQALATCLIEHGEIEKAKATLAQIDRPAADGIEEWVVALEALLHAVSGDAAEALALADMNGDADGALLASFEVVRAHAYASQGKSSKARQALERVATLAGSRGLERVLRPAGPASELAQALIGETDEKVAKGSASVN